MTNKNFSMVRRLGAAIVGEGPADPASEQLRALRKNWYGLALVSSVGTLFEMGIGPLSIMATGIGALVGLAVVWLVGNRLMARSEKVRGWVVVGAAIGTGFSLLRVGWLTRSLLQGGSFFLVFSVAFNLVAAALFVKSLLVLANPRVRATFR